MKMTPKSAVKELYNKAGGILNAKSMSEIPRDRRQVTNAKHKMQSTSGIASNHGKDLVYDLLEQHFGSCKTLYPECFI